MTWRLSLHCSHLGCRQVVYVAQSTTPTPNTATQVRERAILEGWKMFMSGAWYCEVHKK